MSLPVRSLRSTVPVVVALSLLAPMAASTPPAAAVRDGTPTVGTSVRNDLSPPLADLARTQPPVSLTGYREHDETLPLPPGGAPRVDPALDRSASLDAMPEPLLTFEGNDGVDNPGALFLLPPDTNGDVGLDHYVQWVNLVLSVWTKDGTRVLGPVAGNTIWSGFGGVCQTTNNGDPIVRYDHLADRWMISQFAVPGGSAGYHECVAVSQTPDPTGAWYRYDFRLSNTVFNDYPKLSVWPDAYYMSIVQFAPGYAGPGAVAFEREAMLAGEPARFVYFEQGRNPGLRPQLPADLDGSNPPPAGSPSYFVASVDGTPDRLSVHRFRVDWSDPAASTFTGPVDLPVAAFDSEMCPSGDPTRGCIPQAGSPARLDDISDRVMYRLAYRNFGDHESMVVNQTVDVNGLDLAGVRWYELRRSGGEWAVHQQSTFSPGIELPQGVHVPNPVDHRWMGSIAMDSSGNMGLGYSISGVHRFPSVAYTGRLDGDDPNTMPQGEVIMWPGEGSQHFVIGRWGDYSSMTVDPTDDCTFWYTNEYYPVAPAEGVNLSPWHTRIGAFRFPQCGSDLEVAVAAPDEVPTGSSITYEVTVTNPGPGASQGVTLTDALPAGTTLVSAAPSRGTCEGEAEVTCALGTLGIGESAVVEIVVVAGQPGTLENVATAASVTRDPDAANNAVTSVTAVT